MARVAAVTRIQRAVAAALADLAADAAVGVACSGGADSIALADAAIAVVGAARVVVLHVDHGLHADSAGVAQAVAGWARGVGARAEIVRVKVARRASLEDAARQARYAALDRLAAPLGCVLTAHTARDQAETVLLRVMRGTGPAGLAGIPAVRGPYRRPLLAVPRADIEAYVAARRLPVIEDPMNTDERFARVRVRRSIMPRLAVENPRIEEALNRLARGAAEWAAALPSPDAAVAPGGAGATLEVAALRALGPAAGKRAIAARVPGLAAVHLDAAWALVLAPRRGTRTLSIPGATLERSYDTLRLVVAGAALEPVGALEIVGPDGPYELRRWRPGDRMRPARLRGRSRKLSDLFVDARVPRRARATARIVVVASSGTIVWAEHLGGAYGVTISVRGDAPA